MDRLKALIREPALLLDAFESVIVVAIALGFLNLTGDQQTNTVALFIAVLALAKGFLTKPFPVTVIPDLGRAGLVFAVSLGLLKYTPDQVTVVVTMLGTIVTLVARAQITPRYETPIVRPGGAGAGPVTGIPDNETGEASVAYLGYVLLVVGVILLILSLLGFLPIYWAVICLVVGVILWFLGSRSRRF